MNYGLFKIYQEDKFKNYEYFLLLTNDSEVSQSLYQGISQYNEQG